MKDDYTTNSLPHLYIFSLKGWENVLFERGSGNGYILKIIIYLEEKTSSFELFQLIVLTLSLPRVINVKFPLQPHQ